ncbi:MAG: hypothetical protein IPK19_22070 [Chloroflexi bacterium]|nr:hypothetical protein [Chloroflexota bacterium]
MVQVEGAGGLLRHVGQQMRLVELRGDLQRHVGGKLKVAGGLVNALLQAFLRGAQQLVRVFQRRAAQTFLKAQVVDEQINDGARDEHEVQG